MDKQIFLCARFQAKSEYKDELKSRLIEMVRLTNLEEGCLFYDLHEDINDGTIFYFIEGWRNKVAHELHEQTHYIRAIIEDAPRLTIGGIRVDFMHRISPK